MLNFSRDRAKFNDKIIKVVSLEMKTACGCHPNVSHEELLKRFDEVRIDAKTLGVWMSRLENLTIPGKITEYPELDEKRKTQLERINELVSMLDNKLEFYRARQIKESEKKEKREKRQAEMEHLAGEIVAYAQEKFEAEKAMKPVQESIRRGGMGKVDWKTLKQLNEDLYEASFGLLVAMQRLREINPDLMLRLYPAVAKMGSEAKQAYVEVLKTFVMTHNSFKWSQEAMESCEKHTPGLAQVLKQILKNRPKQDEELAFHQSVTKLPHKVLKDIYQPNLPGNN